MADRADYYYLDPPLRPSAPLRPRPEQVLAAGIVRLALSDLRNPCVGPEVRQDARAFLRGEGGSLDFWLLVLGLDPHARAAVRQRLAARVNGNGGRPEQAKTPDFIGQTADEA
jgi:hypothetical protein